MIEENPLDSGIPISARKELEDQLWNLGNRYPQERETIIHLIQLIDRFASEMREFSAPRLGETIRSVRLTLKKSQRAFATILRVKQQSLSRIEMGKPIGRKLKKALSEILQMPYEDMIRLTQIEFRDLLCQALEKSSAGAPEDIFTT